ASRSPDRARSTGASAPRSAGAAVCQPEPASVMAFTMRRGREISGMFTRAGQKQSPLRDPKGLLRLLPGNDLLSHALTRAVPSALRGLTAVFGMGTGV